MTCPCRATEYALLENAKRGKRITELEDALVLAEERLEQMTRERDEARAEVEHAYREGGALYEAKIAEREAEAERDEARAEVEKLSESANAAWEAECVMRDQRDRYHAEWKQERQEVERLRERLRFDPGGSDKIDELEDAVKYLRAEVERMRAEADRWERSCNVFRERDWPKAFQATVTSLEKEVSDAYEQLATLHKLSKPWEGNAYRRGAEAMRKAAVAWLENNYASIDAEYISALPIPEEP